MADYSDSFQAREVDRQTRDQAALPGAIDHQHFNRVCRERDAALAESYPRRLRAALAEMETICPPAGRGAQ